MFTFRYSAAYAGETCRDWLCDAIKAFYIRFGHTPTEVALGSSFLSRLLAWSERGDDGVATVLKQLHDDGSALIFGVRFILEPEIVDRSILTFIVTQDAVAGDSDKECEEDHS